MEVLGYIASLFMGVVLGLMGGGGSILTVPIMVYLFGLSPTVATGYSLFVVGTTALIGSSLYIRKGDVDFKAGVFFAVPSMIGVHVSRSLVLPAIPEVIASFPGFTLTREILVMATFAVLMIAASYSMIAKKKGQNQTADASSTRVAPLVTQGFVVGIVAGFVGAGGGFLIIPALVLFAGLSMRIAVGTSLMIIALQSLAGFSGDLARGAEVNWPLLGTVAAIAAAGIVAGSSIAHKIKEQKLKSAFGWFVLAMGSGILIEQIHRLSFR
jgi:uncharacterized membrane protein YfcA